MYICITYTCTWTYTCTYIYIYVTYISFQVAQVVKNLPVNTRDVRNMGLIPESGRFPGGRHGNPFEYSWLGESRGAWQVTIHRAAKSFIWLKWLSIYIYTHTHTHTHTHSKKMLLSFFYNYNRTFIKIGTGLLFHCHFPRIYKNAWYIVHAQ